MNDYALKQGADQLKPLKVMDRYFLYNEVTAGHAEVDSKTWTLVCNARKNTSGCWDSRELATKVVSLVEVPPCCADKLAVPDLRNLILQVSQSCNLRCKYCCADFGRYGRSFRVMSLNVAKRAIDFLFDATKSSHLGITYFGGEPLLNLDTVLHSARYSLDRANKAGKEVSLHLVTNGVLLNFKTLRALDSFGFSLTVSLDGPPEYHDNYRPFPRGMGSFKFTAESLRLAASLPIWYRTTVRGTFTRHTAYFFPVVKYLADENFSRNIAYEPVFLPSSHPLAIRWQDLSAIKQAYAHLANYYVKRLKQKPFCLWDFDDAIHQLIVGRPRQSRCGAGTTTLAVTAEGDIYACHMSTGMENAWIGNLDKGIVNRRRQPWEDSYLQRTTGCSDCWIRALCGGGCGAHAIFYNADLSTPYRLECELIKWRYRLALWILAQFPDLREIVRSSTDFRINEKQDSGHVSVPLWYYLE